MRRKSSKATRLQRARATTRDLVLARDQGCRGAALVPHVACFGGLDVHELLTRARGGSITDPDNCVALCRGHHNWVHDHPADATAVGLLRKAGGS